jgi:Lrp/AsnC family transcriptional regulator, leucine-responsive regulatory protein
MSDTIKLDKIDYEILEILRKNGRIKRNDLAERVGLSLPSVSERLKKLEEEHIILGYIAKINSERLGYLITAFITISMESSKYFPNLIAKSKELDEILECHAITGDGTYLLKIKTQSTNTLEKLLAKIQSWTGVMNTKTNIVLSTPKEELNIKVIKKYQE